jgi:hypothetical protein
MSVLGDLGVNMVVDEGAVHGLILVVLFLLLILFSKRTG